MLVLVCVALLSTRLTGAHLHLCVDGSEPPASLHFNDGGHHIDHHVSDQHHDVDVPGMADATSKSVKPGAGLDLLLVLLAVFIWPWLGQNRAPPNRRDPQRSATTGSPHLRPPLRGPPLHAA